MPKKPGPALDWSDDDIDNLVEITPADIEAAKIWWRDHAPPAFADLLDATLDLEQEQLTNDGTI